MSTESEVARRVTVVSVILIIVGVVLGVRTGIVVASSHRASGFVESVGNIGTDGKGYPVTISFRDDHGVPHLLRTTSQRTIATNFRSGEAVQVLFDPVDPVGTAQVNRVTRVWLWPGICLIAGIFFLVFRVPLARQGANIESARPAGDG